MAFSDSRKRIHVVAGIIWSDDKFSVLISKRPEHLHQGGYWEFPGGKLEQDETEEAALARELYEELNIRFSSCEKFHDIDFDYPDKQVKLAFYHVYNIYGDILANEQQQWCWTLLRDLKNFSFPEANQSIVDALIEVI